MRDEHQITTESTSPPHKKLKKTESKNQMEVMEIDNNCINELNESFEEMEIEETDVELKTLSEMMDKKIKDKENSEKEEEKQRIYDKKKAERKQREEEEQKRIYNKKRKQSLKDSRKANNKKNKKSLLVEKNINQFENVPNVREIPQNCKKLLKDDDILYVVPGDGACALNCAAAFLFGDEIFCPKSNFELVFPGIIQLEYLLTIIIY